MKKLQITLFNLILLLICIGFMSSSLYAQNNANNSYTFWNAEMQAIAKPESKPGWVYFKDNFNTPIQDIFTTHAVAFGLGSNDSMVLVKQKTDDLGWEHITYKHYYEGYNVLTSQTTFHSNGNTKYFSGEIVSNIIIQNSYYKLNQTESQHFYNYITSHNYDSSNVNIIMGDTVYYPIDMNNDRFVKCFKKIYTAIGENYISLEYYVNVSNDLIVDFIELHNDNCYNNTYFDDITYYNQERSYYYDSIGYNAFMTQGTGPGGTPITYYDRHYLIDRSRGEGIENYFVFDHPTGIYYHIDLGYIQTFEDTDIVAFPQFDSNFSIQSVYHGANVLNNNQIIYDYLLNVHNMNSIDNHGARIRTLTRTSSNQFPGVNHATQFIDSDINPYLSYYYFGEALDFILCGSNCSHIDVLGHEIAHGIVKYGTNFFNAPFYIESKILEEGFCDIMGHIIQDYVRREGILNINDPEWYYFENTIIPRNVNRSMADPKSDSSNIGVTLYGDGDGLWHRHPNYYKGQNWVPINNISNDTLMIVAEKINNTVFSHWFYLAVNGGAITNEVGEQYNISSVDIEKMAKIMMRTVYQSIVPPNADFHDMRRATIQATIELYGYCDELISIMDAWDAVGVYDSSLRYNNHLINYVLTSDTAIWNDTLYIDGYLKVKNGSNLTFYGSHIYLNNNSFLEVDDNSTLYTYNSNFYCSSNSSIEIKNTGSIVSSQNIYSFNNLDPCQSFSSKLWNGIKCSNNWYISNLIFNNDSIKNAICGINITKNNGNNEPYIEISESSFDDNAKALNIAYLTAINNFYSNDSILILNNKFYNPRMEYTDQNGQDFFYADYPIINSLNLSPDFFMEYVSILNVDAKIINNEFHIQSPPITIGTINSNYIPLNLICPLNPLQNSFPSSIKALGIKSNSNTLSVNIENNTFNNWKNSIWMHQGLGNTHVKNNTFTNGDDIDPMPHLFCNGKATIENNTFNDDNKGIQLIESDGSVISNNTFNKTYQNIYLQAGSNNAIKNNVFTNMLNSNQFEGFGIHNYGSESCIIEGNSFNETTSYGSQYGIIIDNVGNAPSYIFNNSFAQLNYAVQTDEMNTGLKIKCNKFATNGIAHQAGIFAIDGYLANQGANCNNTGNNWQAGNEWIDNTTSSSNSISKDILLGPNMQAFEYWAHGFNTLTGNNNTNPQKNNFDQFSSNILTVCENINPGTNDDDDYREKDNSSCVDIYDGWHRPIDINEDLLIKLTDLINIRTNHINELSTLESMLYNPDTQHDIVEKIKYYQQEIKLVNEGIIEIYKKTGNDVALTVLLESDNSIEAKQKLYKQYLEKKDYVNAARVLNEMQQSYNPDYFYANTVELQKNEDNKNYFATLAEIEGQLRTDNRKLSELNEAEIQTLRTIKIANLPVSAKAEVLLAYNGDTLYQRTIKKLSTHTMDSLLSGTNGFNYNLTLTPNPATTQVEVCFALPNNAQNIKLSLIDEYNHVGLLLDEKSVGEQEICKTFNTTAYNNGTYRVVLEHDGAVQAGKHLLIVR